MFTWWSHNAYVHMVVTWWSHGGHMHTLTDLSDSILSGVVSADARWPPLESSDLKEFDRLSSLGSIGERSGGGSLAPTKGFPLCVAPESPSFGFTASGLLSWLPLGTAFTAACFSRDVKGVVVTGGLPQSRKQLLMSLLFSETATVLTSPHTTACMGGGHLTFRGGPSGAVCVGAR